MTTSYQIKGRNGLDQVLLNSIIVLAVSIRNTSDERDGHQRICLHAEILTPYHEKVLCDKCEYCFYYKLHCIYMQVHTFVTHLSLSGDAQKKYVRCTM